MYQLQADTLSPASLIEAMEKGHFYASTGVTLKKYSSDGDRIDVEVDPEPEAIYTITFMGCKQGKDTIETFGTVQGNQASFEVAKDMLFVRCKIVSSKIQDYPSEDVLYQTAWTQPVQPNP